MKELRKGQVRACSEVAKRGLSLCGAKIEENLLFMGIRGVFGKESEEGFGGWI